METLANLRGGAGFDVRVSWPIAPDYSWLNDILAGSRDGDPLPEIKWIYRTLSPGIELSFLDRVYRDITAMFSGTYPGFRGCVPCDYHDLRHTRNVALAVMRLLHGLFCRGVQLPEDIIRLGLLCAFFHDTGILLRDSDLAETGAAYLQEHERRSVVFLREYLIKENLCLEHYEKCQAIIDCTNLMAEPSHLPFLDADLMVIAQVVGSADIMAQMADRYYLESLPHLFEEFRLAGIERYDSAMELLRQTASFYHEVIGKRLRDVFGGVGEAMRDHFRVRWNIDRNLYSAAMENNIRYLETCIAACGDDDSLLIHYLRRKLPPVR